MLKRFLRDPLLHFLLIGGALFILYSLQNDDKETDNSHRIVISKAQIDHLSAYWEKRWLRPPTREELDGIIEKKIQEEVYYREALAMGLDNNDSIIRRRLAQKVRFMLSDIIPQTEPTDAQLKAFLDDNMEKFMLPASISFKQIYFNADKRGVKAHNVAVNLLTNLNQTGSPADIAHYGDNFMFAQQYDHLSETDVIRIFGEEFARKLFSLPAGQWQGPIASAYGLHLVLVDNRNTPEKPDMDVIYARVHTRWLDEQRRLHNESLYKNLRQQYDVVIEDTDMVEKP